MVTFQGSVHQDTPVPAPYNNPVAGDHTQQRRFVDCLNTAQRVLECRMVNKASFHIDLEN